MAAAGSARSFSLSTPWKMTASPGRRRRRARRGMAGRTISAKGRVPSAPARARARPGRRGRPRPGRCGACARGQAEPLASRHGGGEAGGAVSRKSSACTRPPRLAVEEEAAAGQVSGPRIGDGERDRRRHRRVHRVPAARQDLTPTAVAWRSGRPRCHADRAAPGGWRPRRPRRGARRKCLKRAARWASRHRRCGP